MPSPPLAEQRPHLTEIHGRTLTDEYFWLRERGAPEVLAYLEAENDYTAARMAHTRDLQEELFREFRTRLKETDTSVPVKIDDFYYYSRTEEGREYTIECRKRGSLEAPEQVLLDGNRMAEGKDFFRLGVFEVSPDHRYLAYSVDEAGREEYTLRVRDLETGEDLPEAIGRTYYSAAWAADSRTVFYTVLDEAERPFRIMRHRLGTDPGEDTIVYTEADERFHLSLRTTKSRDYILIEAESQITRETLFLDARRPDGAFRVFAPRQDGVEYRVYHHGRHFLVLTNEDAVNFRLLRTPTGKIDRGQWEEVIPHEEEVKLDGLDVFRDHLVLYRRKGGLRGITLYDPDFRRGHDLDFEEPVYTVGAGWNPVYDSDTFRYTYSSLVSPQAVWEYDFTSGRRRLLKQQEVLGGYDPTAYVSRRIWVPARDGRKIPVSLVQRRDLGEDRPRPCLLYGYGSYGISIDPHFSLTRVSLLDRGLVFAIAHVRGGGEMGRRWYEDGKLLHKKNTFYDFIDVAEHLIDTGVTAPDRLAIEGGSAGGMLIGAVLNMRPELFRAAHAAVPFVDVINTMLDESLPLTVIEYEEWGDPHEKEFFEYMLSYSPYDNVSEQHYPDLLITAGLNDPRVQYWEPAKWAARLRARAQGDGLLLLKTEMGAGHSGPSGRYHRLREIAFEYAFFLDRLLEGS
ncbi:MAG: S9 family peptidase [Acidobacteriota bacterium]|nr:S9 family peptidase [Acidobacteriota bacterium]